MEHDEHGPTEHDEDDYAGPATLLVDEQEFAVTVRLRGNFQPIDGYFHWYGRLAAHEALAELVGSRKRQVTLRTPEGSADGQLSDPDPWSRYRIAGTSTPPFAVPALTDGSDEP